MKQFKKHVEAANREFGGTLQVGDVYLNEGWIINPRRNSGKRYCFVGQNQFERTYAAMRRQLKRTGGAYIFKGVNYTAQ